MTLPSHPVSARPKILSNPTTKTIAFTPARPNLNRNMEGRVHTEKSFLEQAKAVALTMENGTEELPVDARSVVVRCDSRAYDHHLTNRQSLFVGRLESGTGTFAVFLTR
ncbi:MAG TPA: hypothetical protein VGD78_01775 [Chthoniobacterales bacterium]